jgi:hypothetical protein
MNVEPDPQAGVASHAACDGRCCEFARDENGATLVFENENRELEALCVRCGEWQTVCERTRLPGVYCPRFSTAIDTESWLEGENAVARAR